MITPAWVADQAKEINSASAEQMLTWAVENFTSRVGLTCTFGGAGFILAHMLNRIAPDVPVFFPDTQFLSPENYALKDEMIRRYGINVVHVRPLQTPQEQQEQFGWMLWESNPDLCCSLRKVEPIERALDGIDVWIVGLRHEHLTDGQSASPIQYCELTFGRPLVKLAPLINWTEEMLSRYVADHGLPSTPTPPWRRQSLRCLQCTKAHVIDPE